MMERQYKEKESVFTIEENRQVARRTWLMRLSGPTDNFSCPGQFVNIRLEGKFLRRPISICDYDSKGITLLYDVVGEGTEQMSHLKPGEKLDMLTGLGNGFDTGAARNRTLLVGGGIGIAPLYALARKLREEGTEIAVVLGFNTAADVSMENEFRAICDDVTVTTADGSAGVKGFVTDAIRQRAEKASYFYSCGPLPMLRALCNEMECDGQLSLDSRMACGFGVCMCCSLRTRDGYRRICADGPVFRKEELIWK